MPQHIALPTANGDVATWTPHGAATVAQAWSDELNSTYATTITASQRACVTFEDLPAEADTVSRVTILALLAGDGLTRARLALRLAGVEDLSADAVAPLEGGYQLFQASFDTAPGGLPWTVARRNAIQGVVLSIDDSADAGIPLNGDTVRLATDYEIAVPTGAPPGEVVDVTFPATRADALFPGDDAPDLSFPATSVDAPFPDSNPVDIAFPVTVERDLSFGGE